MKRDDVIRLAEKAGFYFHTTPEHAPIQHTDPLSYSERCFLRLAEYIETELIQSAPKPARKKRPTYDALGRLVELGVPPEMAETWIKQRKAPLTELAIKLTEKEAQAAGYTMAKAVEEVVVSGWQGFREAYVRGKQGGAKLSRALNTSGKDYGNGGKL